MYSPVCGSKSCRSYPCGPMYGFLSFFSNLIFKGLRTCKPSILFNFTSADIKKKNLTPKENLLFLKKKCIEDEIVGYFLNLPAIGNVTTS